MRVLFATIANSTHFFSMVPAAWALRSAGHEVRVASQPALMETIADAGLTAVPVGTDHDMREKIAASASIPADAPNIDFTHVREGTYDFHHLLGFYTILTPALFATMNNDTMVDDLVAYAREWQPDLVVWEPMTWSGAVAAKAAGAAHARLLWGTDVLGLIRQQFLGALDRQPAEVHEDPFAEWLGWTVAKYGLEFDEELTTGQWTIEQEPPSLQVRTDRRTVSMQYVPYNGRAVLPDWLREPPSRPRVCLTLGISAREGIGRSTVSVADMVDSLSELDIELVATLNADQRAALGEVRENVRLVDFVPLHALLPTCSAVIHHGGAGTWSTATRAGVPQVVVPEIWDTGLKATMLAELGAGVHQPIRTMTADSLRDHVRRILEDQSYTEAAAKLQNEMRSQRSPAEVVTELERLTSERRG
ncbi:glycosyl transferase family 28 [Amycolatopsis antarctica]|uniref:Glycosyl transferase family 28 n=2 Tax=Amycolatopsis antarctica TaxID=1854586 RepID=A0A263D5T9_9PSEU|nr:glycosyl transferase family 28 [Amycolatopsis antarctica]